jgi:hypothetical protein
MAVSRLNLTLLDKEGEASTISVYATALTAGNFATQMGLADAFVAAIEDVTKMVLSKDSRVAVETGFNPVLPTDIYAQRGIKFLVRARDTNGNSVTFHIPGARLDLPGLMSGENIDLTSVEGAALLNATEAYVKSNDGEAVTVTEIVYID